VAISDPATAHFTTHKKNLGNTRNCIQTRHTHTHTHTHKTLEARKTQVAISDTATHKPQNQFPKCCVIISISYLFVCHCVFVCILYWYFGPPCVLWFVCSCVTNCHLGFPGLLCLKGVCGFACAWVCMQFLCFLGFLCAVKCAVAGSLIATCV
jgi:hypothetical protein